MSKGGPAKLGKKIRLKPVKPVSNTGATGLEAKVEHDDYGYRYTAVNSSAEKIKLGDSRLLQMVTDPTGGAVYAIFEGESTVKVFDTEDMSLAGEIGVPKDPVALWSDENRIFVSCDKSKLIAEIDSSKFEVSRVIRLPNRDLVPGRIPGLAPDGGLMTLWKTTSGARWDTYLYLLYEGRKRPVEFVKGDIQWCAFTGYKEHLWTQHNFRGSPSGGVDLFVDGKRAGIVSRDPLFASFGGLHKDMCHSFPTSDGKGFVVPVSAQGMPDGETYGSKSMVLAPDLSSIDLWVPGSVICEVPSEGYFVSWSKAAKSSMTPEVLYASCSNGRVIRRVSVAGLKPHPAGFVKRNATPNIIFVPGRELLLFHDMNSRDGEIDLIRCGPVGGQVDVSPAPNIRARNDPPTTAYVGKPFAFTPTFDRPKDAKEIVFRLKKSIKGMAVDSKSGKIEFKPSDANLGLYDIELVADVDGSEVPIVKWTLEIDFAP